MCHLYCPLISVVNHMHVARVCDEKAAFTLTVESLAAPVGVVCTVESGAGGDNLWSPWEGSSTVPILCSRWMTTLWSATSASGFWRAQSFDRQTWRLAQSGTRWTLTRSSGWSWSFGSPSSSSPFSTATFVNSDSSRAARDFSTVLRQMHRSLTPLSLMHNAFDSFIPSCKQVVDAKGLLANGKCPNEECNQQYKRWSAQAVLYIFTTMPWQQASAAYQRGGHVYTHCVCPCPYLACLQQCLSFRFWPSAERFSLSAFRSAGLEDDHEKLEEPPHTTGYPDAATQWLPPPLGEFRRLQESPQRYGGHREGLGTLKRKLQ